MFKFHKKTKNLHRESLEKQLNQLNLTKLDALQKLFKLPTSKSGDELLLFTNLFELWRTVAGAGTDTLDGAEDIKKEAEFLLHAAFAQECGTDFTEKRFTEQRLTTWGKVLNEESELFKRLIDLEKKSIQLGMSSLDGLERLYALQSNLLGKRTAELKELKAYDARKSSKKSKKKKLLEQKIKKLLEDEHQFFLTQGVAFLKDPESFNTEVASQNLPVQEMLETVKRYYDNCETQSMNLFIDYETEPKRPTAPELPQPQSNYDDYKKAMEKYKQEIMHYADKVLLDYEKQLDAFRKNAKDYQKIVDIFYNGVSGYKRFCVLIYLLECMEEAFKKCPNLLASLPTKDEVADRINAIDIRRSLVENLEFKTEEIKFNVDSTGIEFFLSPSSNRDEVFNERYQWFAKKMCTISEINTMSSNKDLPTPLQKFKFSFSSNNFLAIYRVFELIDQAQGHSIQKKGGARMNAAYASASRFNGNGQPESPPSSSTASPLLRNYLC